MYQLKELPEDFQVKEIGQPRLSHGGPYSYFTLRKRNYTTEWAVAIIAEKLHLERRRISYAGAKDRRAVTEQTISIWRAPGSNDLALKDITLHYLGSGNEPVTLGQHTGNAFVITVRNLGKEELVRLALVQPQHSLTFPNYFDEQRFSGGNHLIGRAILKGAYRDAVHRILSFSVKKEEIEGGDYPALLATARPGTERAVLEHLAKEPTDFIGAIKRVPVKIRMMYVHAFQSFIFNETLARWLRKVSGNVIELNYSLGTLVFSRGEIHNRRLPIVGFATEPGDEEAAAIAAELLAQEGITPSDFIMRPFPEMSSEGEERDAMVTAQNLSMTIGDDELHTGMKKATLSFTLPKGAYATMAIKKIFCT